MATTLAARTRKLVRNAVAAYLLQQSGAAAFVWGDEPPSLPVTISTGVNDTFVFTGPDGAEVFTMAPGAYTTLPALSLAAMDATGTNPSSGDSETFGSRCYVTGATNSTLAVTMNATNLSGAGNTITEGNGGAAALGFSEPPDIFAVGPKNVPYLNGVYGFPLKFTEEVAFYDPDVADRTDGALIWLYWPDQKDHRVEFGGEPGDFQGGSKQVDITVNMDIIFKSSSSDTQVVGVNNEDLLDGLVSAIRADRKAGCPSVVYQWGEGDRTPTDTDIVVSSDYPMPIADFQNLAAVYSKVVVKVVVFLETT